MTDVAKQALFTIESAMSDIAHMVESQAVKLKRTLAEGDIKTAMQLGRTLAPLTHKQAELFAMRNFILTKEGEHPDGNN